MSSPLTTDVLVVGAGPAGCAAAIEAVRGGREVLVVDKATFPRDKCCGDGLTTDALRILEELGLDPTDVPNWNAVTDVIVRTPSGRETVLPLPSGGGQYAAVVPRLDLDNQLVELAVRAGAELRQGVGIETVSQVADRVIATTDQGDEIHARYLIAADGMWSNVRKQVGADLPGYRGEWHAFRQYFSNVGPRSQHLIVWFEADLLPGYAWSFPLPGQRANVGFGILRGGDHKVGDMGKLWRDLLERPHVRDVLGPNATPEDTHKAWPIPANIDGLEPTAGRVLFVGDAIGATDPMTGEGIAQALHTGRIAADAITEAGPFDAEAAAAIYRTSVDKSLGRDHRFARSLGKLLRSPSVTNATVGLAGLTPWTRRNFARWMFEDYPRAAILTPDRWHRGMFTGPGAYRSAPPAPDTPAVAPLPATS